MLRTIAPLPDGKVGTRRARTRSPPALHTPTVPTARPLPSPQCRGAYAPCSRAGSSALRGVIWLPAPPHRRRHHPRTRLAFPRVGLAGGSTSPRQPSSSAIATPPGPSPGSAPFPGRARRGHVAQRLPDELLTLPSIPFLLALRRRLCFELRPGPRAARAGLTTRGATTSSRATRPVV